MDAELHRDAAIKGANFGILARLIGTPPTAAQLANLSDLPALSKAALSLPLHADGTLNEEQAAALHQEIFGFNVLPFAGVYLSQDGNVGGEITSNVISILSPLGIAHDPRGESPEHLGRMLQLLDVLDTETRRESGARQQALNGAIIALLDRCLLPWLAPVCVALTQTQHPFFVALAEAIWRETTKRRGQAKPYESPTVTSEVDLLDNPKTGLRQIAEFLASPSRSGILLNTQMITTISRQAKIPRGFGGRQQMLETLLFSAADQRALPRVVRGVLGAVESTQKGYATLGGDQPLGLSIIKPWQERLACTRSVLETLGMAAA